MLSVVFYVVYAFFILFGVCMGIAIVLVAPFMFLGLKQAIREYMRDDN